MRTAIARSASDPWLEASALQARGIARISAEEAFGDWEQAVTRFVVAGDLTSASNVRYMLASRAVEAHTRLDSVPVWLEASEAYASDQGLRHERAHIRYARGSYERLRGHPGTARRLLAEVLPVFRKAGDLRCVARTLLELAQPSVASDPAARTDLLLESLRAAAIAGDPAMHARILADLTTAGFSAGNLILAARCAGALESLGTQAPHKTADPAYATFVEEGRAGGIELLTRLYPGPVGTGTGIPG